MERSQNFRVEARSDFSNVAELIVSIDPQKQRTEILPRTRWLGKTSDDKLILLVKFYFQPLPRSLFHVGSGEVFADDSLKAPLGRYLKRLQAVWRQYCRQQEKSRGLHESFERLTARGKCFHSQILPLGVETVKDRIVWNAFALLQQLEARDFLGVKHNNFAVNAERLWL